MGEAGSRARTVVLEAIEAFAQPIVARDVLAGALERGGLATLPDTAPELIRFLGAHVRAQVLDSLGADVADAVLERALPILAIASEEASAASLPPPSSQRATRPSMRLRQRTPAHVGGRSDFVLAGIGAFASDVVALLPRSSVVVVVETRDELRALYTLRGLDAHTVVALSGHDGALFALASSLLPSVGARTVVLHASLEQRAPLATALRARGSAMLGIGRAGSAAEIALALRVLAAGEPG